MFYLTLGVNQLCTAQPQIQFSPRCHCKETGGHSAKCLLRCVDHVQKSVIIFLALVDLAQRRTVADECTVIHEQVE